MKKAFCLLFALLMLLSCSVGCADDVIPEYEELLVGSWKYEGTNKFSTSERDWDQFPFETIRGFTYLGSHKAMVLTGDDYGNVAEMEYDADLFISVDHAGAMIMTILNTEAYFGYQHDFCGKLYIAQDGTFLVLETNPCEYCYFSKEHSMESQEFTVDGDSMNDTLYAGEKVYVDMDEYGSIWDFSLLDSMGNTQMVTKTVLGGNPGRLDVAACRLPVQEAEISVKRIVGLPGETVELREGYLYIDGVLDAEEADIEGVKAEYRTDIVPQNFGPYYVPKKGDTVVIRKDEAQADGFALYINGSDEPWDRKRSCLVLDVDGELLKIYSWQPNVEGSEWYEVQCGEVITGVYWDIFYRITALDFVEYNPELLDRELTVAEDYYFVMGDHRNNSLDSRSSDVGVLERSAILGHVTKVVAPVEDARDIR